MMTGDVSRVVTLVVFLSVVWTGKAAFAAPPQPPPDSLPRFKAAGTYYEVGKAIGAQAVDRVRYRLENYTDIPTVREYLATAAGHATLMAFFNDSQRIFPELVEEIRGFADGSGFRFVEDIFMLNVLDELEYLLGMDGSGSTILQGAGGGPTGRALTARCTDVMSHVREHHPCWGHNEDGVPGDNHTTYISEVLIFSGVNGTHHPRLVENLTSMAYPGTVAGEAFAWNHHGMLFSENFLTPVRIDAGRTNGAVPAQLINRAVLRCRSMAEVSALLERVQTGIGFSLNVGQISSSSGGPSSTEVFLANFEVDPMNRVAFRRIAFDKRTATDDHEGNMVAAEGWEESSTTTTTTTMQPPSPPGPSYQSKATARDYAYHANDYLSLTMAYQSPKYDPDSWGRVDRLMQFPPPTAPEDIRRMLGDTRNASYPLYGTGNNVFERVTLATCIFDLPTTNAGAGASGGRTASVFIGNPKLTTPLYVFQLP